MKPSTINTVYKNEIDEKTLVKIIKEMKEIKDEIIEVLFTELPVKEFF
jgi:hypothetical protein